MSRTETVEHDAFVAQLDREQILKRGAASHDRRLQTSREELTAANEEVLAINEELESANEVLETSKEELQSVNEEVVTPWRMTKNWLSSKKYKNFSHSTVCGVLKGIWRNLDYAYRFPSKR